MIRTKKYPAAQTATGLHNDQLGGKIVDRSSDVDVGAQGGDRHA
jgi:hypothetical protein